MPVDVPHFFKVRLKFDDGLGGGLHLGPLLHVLLLFELAVKQIDGHAAHPQQNQIHRGAGGIDVAQVAFAQFVFCPQLGQGAPRIFAVGGETEHDDRNQQQQDATQIDQLSLLRGQRVHLDSNSRIRSAKYPSRTHGSR